MGDGINYFLGILGLTEVERRTSVSVAYNLVCEEYQKLALMTRLVNEWRTVVGKVNLPLHSWFSDGTEFRRYDLQYDRSQTDGEVLQAGLDEVTAKMRDKIASRSNGRFVVSDKLPSITIYDSVDERVVEKIWRSYGSPQFEKEYEKIKPSETAVPMGKPLSPELKNYLQRRLEQLLE